MQINNKNYFQLFALSESYDLDADKLMIEYHKLQLDYHPDKHSSASEEQKMAWMREQAEGNEGPFRDEDGNWVLDAETEFDRRAAKPWLFPRMQAEEERPK